MTTEIHGIAIPAQVIRRSVGAYAETLAIIDRQAPADWDSRRRHEAAMNAFLAATILGLMERFGGREGGGIMSGLAAAPSAVSIMLGISPAAHAGMIQSLHEAVDAGDAAYRLATQTAGRT